MLEEKGKEKGGEKPEHESEVSFQQEEKSNVVLIYVWSVTCNRDEVIVLLYAEAVAALQGSAS